MRNNSDINLYISLDAIANNYYFFNSHTEKSTCAAVVKANAYGLGVEQVSKKLFSIGCRNFFVANLDEAIQLRRVLGQGEDISIYVFHGAKKNEGELFEEHNLIPVLNDFYQIEYWSEFQSLRGTNSPCIIHVDSGMNRLGVNFLELDKLINFIKSDKSLNIKYIMSHLSCITEAEHPLNQLQLERVREIRAKLPEYPITFANSKGTACCPNYHFDMVRPGSGLYGIRGKYKIPVEKVVKITGKILQIREIMDEGYIGYGAIAKLPKGSKVAIIPIGYADGYPRINSDKIYAYYKGQKIPQVGLISMDMTIFDISSIPDNQISVGDEIELVNNEIDVDLVSSLAGTIGYEFMTGLGDRFNRVYL